MMRCPKCAHVRSPDETHVHPKICPACGIAYAKWRGKTQQPRDDTTATNTSASDETQQPFLLRLREQLLELPQETEPVGLWARAALGAGLALWTVHFARHGVDWEVIGGSFLHNANLAFHEFGHLFFRPFGEFMMILGGSLFQVLLPLALMLVFVIRQRDNFAASVCLWWGGQNLVDIAPYIGDAEYRLLPLVGGAGEESHDWGNLLGMLDAVQHCRALAQTSFSAGILVMLCALGWGAWLLLALHRQQRG
jgi:hypothetical protein